MRDRSITFGRAAAMALAATLALASTGPRAGTYAPENPLADLQVAISTFRETETIAKKTPSQVTVTAYAQAAMTMSNVACDAWLTALGKADRDTSLWKGMLNVVGNLILGVAGINGASSDSLARGALGMSAMNAGLDTWRQEILMGVIEEVSPKIKEGRRTAEDVQLQNIAKANYDLQSAQRRLMDYHDMCSRVEIRKLLKEALSAVRYAPADTSLLTATNHAKVDLLAGDLFRSLYPNSSLAVAEFTARDLYQLWVAAIAYPADSGTAYISNIKSNAIVKLHLAALAALPATEQARLHRNLNQIAELSGFPKKLETELANAREQEANEKESVEAGKALRMKQDASQRVEALKLALAPAKGRIDVPVESLAPQAATQQVRGLLARLRPQVEELAKQPSAALPIAGAQPQQPASPVLNEAQRMEIQRQIEALHQATDAVDRQDAIAATASETAQRTRETVVRSRSQGTPMTEMRIVPVAR